MCGHVTFEGKAPGLTTGSDLTLSRRRFGGYQEEIYWGSKVGNSRGSRTAHDCYCHKSELYFS